ncbi:MAG: carboxypeptidase regulatory-like domain-containing protein, partial [Thermodesulfobacteriota bacterium]
MRSPSVKFIGFILIIGILLLALIGCGSTGSMDDGTDGDGGGGGDDGTPPQPSFNFSGTVFGSNGNPFSGVTIYVFSPQYTTTTNSDGDYSLNVSNEMHTLLASKTGYLETFNLVDLSGGGSADQPVVLYPSPVTAVNVLATAGTATPIQSNVIGSERATLTIPPQNSGVFQVGNQSGVNSVGISLVNIDLNSPLSAPMPSNFTLAGEDTLIGGKQAPKTMVSVQPALLNMDTAATLMLPQQEGFTVNRVLRFDPDTHKWQVVNDAGDTTIGITQGGIYGIFYEEARTASVRGTANPGTTVWIGDEMFNVGGDGTFFMDEIPVPPSGPVTVVGLGPADPETGVRTMVQRQLNLTPGEESTVTVLPVPDSLSLSTSRITVKSDNSDSALITATVLNSNNAPFAGVDVSFDVDSGLLMPAEELPEGEQFDPTAVTTGTDGIAQVRFSSGTADKSNRTVSVTARAPGLAAKSIPIQITGTTVSIDNDRSNLSVEGDEEATLTLTVQDASQKPIFDAPVNVSVEPAGALSWTTADGDFRTDVTGQVTLKVSGSQQADEAVLTINTMGTTASQTYNVSSTATLFAIISPDTDPFAQPTNQELPIVVRAPEQNQVRFSTTFGTWENGSKVIDVNVTEDTATARLKSAEAGLATVQVLDNNDPNTSDTIQIAISAPSSEASQLSLQPSAGVIQPSTGDVSNTITLRATVKNATDQVVGGAPVAFSLEQTTGGGETISPVVVFTNSQGVATTTFFSGALPSGGQGVLIRAQVVGKPSVADSRRIIIGGTAGSVVIGRSTQVQSSDNNTYYTLPMSVVVSDSNGNPVTGAEVTLGAWPVGYSTGFWTDEPCVPVITSTLENEDENRNLTLDPGEDINEDGQLTPPNSAAGNAIPSIITTDENGVANFDLVYLKASAVWIVDEITATTLVSGTETQSKLVFRLPFEEGEACELPNSPYAGDETGGDIQIESEFSRLLANGRSESTITATVLNANGSLAEAGTVVQFTVTQGGGG